MKSTRRSAIINLRDSAVGLGLRTSRFSRAPKADLHDMRTGMWSVQLKKHKDTEKNSGTVRSYRPRIFLCVFVFLVHDLVSNDLPAFHHELHPLKFGDVGERVA